MKKTSDSVQNLALLIRNLRAERGLTQQELAEQAGVSFSFINQVEGGKQTLRLDVLNKLLSIFGYTMVPTQVDRNDE
jgi:y4mF family transcriptional regulator